jgi:hypothetical protein
LGRLVSHAHRTTLHLPRSLVLAALLVAVVGSRGPGGQRVSAGEAALDAAGAAWTIPGRGNRPLPEHAVVRLAHVAIPMKCFTGAATASGAGTPVHGSPCRNVGYVPRLLGTCGSEGVRHVRRRLPGHHEGTGRWLVCHGADVAPPARGRRVAGGQHLAVRAPRYVTSARRLRWSDRPHPSSPVGFSAWPSGRRCAGTCGHALRY